MRIKSLKSILPFYKDYLKCRKSKIHNLTYFKFILFRLLGRFYTYYYPVHRNCIISNQRKVVVGINSTIARPGCYIQGAGGIKIGNYVSLAPNVGLLTTNHDLYNQDKYNSSPIVIGDYS